MANANRHGGLLKRLTGCFSSLARSRVPEYYLLLAEAVRPVSINFRLMFRDWQSKLAPRRKAPELCPYSLQAAQNSGAFLVDTGSAVHGIFT